MPSQDFSAIIRPASEDAEDLLAALTELSSQLVEATRSGAPTAHLISASVPLFGRLRAIHRNAAIAQKDRRVSAAEVRQEVDTADLALQNLQYEKAHLEREIRACQSYESEYGALPLLTVEEYAAAIAPEEPQADEHELMLARLAHELNERKRLEVERKDLQLRKGKIGKANDEKKARLDQIEEQLNGFLESAKSIQLKMASFA